MFIVWIYVNIKIFLEIQMKAYRIFNLAIADILMTIFAAVLISFYFKKSFLLTLIVLFIIGIILHRLFCVRTTVDKLLFHE
jgi:hypothetical protein